MFKKIVSVLFFGIILAFAGVDINSASKKELIKLKGIGPAKAKAIMKYRRKQKFVKIEDIMNVKGIGPKIFEKIKDDIEVGE
ncbi:ComEA family DNA-binding protein [Nitrosophilus alvini]|uniref:ComEA family DNA-binding protein n=1 Tax=Nitrosophilus alvini TaxID=2714855 RepID=UPI00190E3A6E|nr:helix-hairpin-helix domain-containing protein [Nitrosophilus alvini]